MLSLIEMINRAAAAVGPIVLAILWQSALLAVAVALIAMTLRRTSPAVRYWLWQILAIKLLLMPFWASTLNIDWPIPFASIVSECDELTNLGQSEFSIAIPDAATGLNATQQPVPPINSGLVTEPPLLSAITWSGWLLLTWVTIMVFQLVQLIFRRRRLARLLSSAITAEGDIIALVQEVTRSLSLKDPPRVLLTLENCSPFVYGILHPQLVLSKSLLETLSSVQRRHVVLHELTHIKRRDLVWCWIPQLATILFFFNPVVHFVRHRIRLESELACDQQAMQSECDSPTNYVQTLLLVMSHISQPSQLQRSSV